LENFLQNIVIFILPINQKNNAPGTFGYERNKMLDDITKLDADIGEAIEKLDKYYLEQIVDKIPKFNKGNSKQLDASMLEWQQGDEN